jgi:MarR family transcriptional regulator for hemolysin
MTFSPSCRSRSSGVVPDAEAGIQFGDPRVESLAQSCQLVPHGTSGRRESIEQPSMTELLARMERDGMIERTPNPDDGR